MSYCMSSVSLDIFFFFKQKTAYEMRISDWSSDVCSSDLGPPAFTYAGDSMTMARVGISQDVPNAAKRHAQQARAQADIAAAEANGFVEVRRVKVATALAWRSEEHTSELQSLMRISYAVFCLTKKKQLYEA